LTGTRAELTALALCPTGEKMLAKVLQAADPKLAFERERLVLASTADGKGGATNPGVRHWLRYCIWGRHVNPVRSADETAPRAERLADEDLLMDFALWLVYCKPCGKSIAPKTARKYVSQVQGWHERQPGIGFKIGGGMKLARLAAMIKALRKERGDAAPMRRWGVRTQDLARAMEVGLSSGTAAEQNWRAALTVAFCGLLRGGEFALQDGEELDIARHLTRADVRFYAEGGCQYAAITIRQLKSKTTLGKTVEVVLRGGGSLFDPVHELRRLFELDPCSEERKHLTPLFRDAQHAAFTVAKVRAMVKALMAAIGCDPKRFGAHSLRIGGATAALAAGVDPAIIRCMGRWSSDVYEIYMRLTREVATQVSATVASTPFHDMERAFQTDALDEAVEIPRYDVELDADDEDEM
jgi:hypothetical protein